MDLGLRWLPHDEPTMAKAIILFALVLALIVGLIMTLRISAKTGTPSKEMLERVRRRARGLDVQDKDHDD